LQQPPEGNIDFGGCQKIKGGSERTTREGEAERPKLLEPPSSNVSYYKIINNFNGVNTVFLNYKLCIFPSASNVNAKKPSLFVSR
jgi:hypothetical protein